MLFSHPELVRELLTGFTPFTVFDGVALSAFERVNPVYASEPPSARPSGIVWRVQIGDEFVYVYIVLELQCGVDHWMALRMQTEVSMLCLELIEHHGCSSDLRLPIVVPIVFYNGAPLWSASKDLAELLMEAPAEIEALQPSQRYVLIDQQRLDRAALDANADLLALLFRIELSTFPEIVQKHLPALMTWLRDTSQTSLRNSVIAWCKALRASKSENAEVLSSGDTEADADMESTMFSWAEQMQEIGFQQGCEKGKAEGKAEGVEEGQAIALRRALDSLLHRRFGSLPAPAAERIGQASQAQLEAWLDRVLTAPSLSALFGDDEAAAPGAPD